MEKIKLYIQLLFERKGVSIAQNRSHLFDEFIKNESSIEIVNQIFDNQNVLMNKWTLRNRIEDIIAQHIIIPNATVGKNYLAFVDFDKLNLTDLVNFKFDDLSEFGLTFNSSTNVIEGTPILSGDFKIKCFFSVKGESENEEQHQKLIPLIINPDPKTLWKDIPSDENAIFWKKDNDSAFEQLGKKHVVVASKRGRSHQNVGSFRDDDFAFKHYVNNGWSAVAVADGAGGYSLSRQGSKIACNAVIEYFEQTEDLSIESNFEQKILNFIETKDEIVLQEAENLSKQILYKATTFAHNKIREAATKTNNENRELFDNPKAKTPLDYFHSTLIFALFKKYDFGYLILSFGVGDCPIAVMDKTQTETSLLNWLDVGEFGGGTRFITQRDIFDSNRMGTRFNFRIMTDFAYLFLMTDGIYDPKFVVEANLEKHEKWLSFLDDLKGNNEDKVAVDFNPENKEIEDQFLKWMDFWSSGNHDDRTLAVIF